MNLTATPYPYQQAGIDFAYSKKYSLNGDQMGLGKTLQALGVAVKANAKKTLVVCPAFLRNNWKSEIEKFTDDPTRFKVVSYGSLGKIVSLNPYDFVVCDEAHYLKNMTAKRTKVFHELVIDAPPKRLMLLSGTPIKNRVTEFYSLLRLVWLGGEYPEFSKYSGSAWAFNRMFSKETHLKMGGRKFTKWEGLKNVEELKALIKPIYKRRKVDQVLDLPRTVHSDLVIAPRSKEDKALEAAFEEYSGKKTKTFATAKAISALSKVRYTLEHVEQLIEQERGVIVFTDHVQSAAALKAGIYKSQAITGATPMNDRSRYVDMLNAGEIPALVATIGALSVGVNLTGICDMVFNDFAWVPADMAQAKARIHRIGQAKTCHYYYMLSSKVDQKILNTLREKEKIIQEVDSET